MKIEDLVKGKLYRHPDYNFELSYMGENHKAIYFSGTAFMFCKKHTGNWQFLQVEEIEQLTEVREIINKNTLNYLLVKNDEFVETYCREDMITELHGVHMSNNLNEVIGVRNDLIKESPNLFTLENLSIVKVNSNIIELTEEDIQKELENV